MEWGIYEWNVLLGVYELIEIIDDYKDALEYKRRGYLVEEYHDED